MRNPGLRRLLLWPALAACTLAAYGPVLRGGFIWDDDGHVTRPELRSLEGLRRIWTEPGATQQYYPVLHSAFWLEHRVWGDAPMGYHVFNVLLHAVAAGLFVAVLLRLRFAPAPAWLAGFLFALHPMGVESVAWISEQKNTLSMVFYLLAALAYVEAASSPLIDVHKRRGRRFHYWLATVFFVLALFSKTVTATLPAALLVILWWRKGRLSWREDILPLLPWLVLGIAAGLFTAWFERSYIGAQGVHFRLSVAQRFLLAARDVWFYLAKLFWPSRLIFVYPRWTIDAGAVGAWAAPAALAALLAATWIGRRGGRGLLAGLLLFAGSLFPALGFVNVYPFVFSYVADHFAYLASLAVFAFAAAGWARLGQRPWMAVGVLALLGVLTWRQCRQYRDNGTLFLATVERNPSSWLAQENLGVVLADRGRYDEAMAHDREALRLNPDYAETHANYGNALVVERRWPEAAAEYASALRLRPDFLPAIANWSEAEYAWASALGNSGRLEEAIAHYRKAVELRPKFAGAWSELGLAEAYSGRPAAAEKDLRRALAIDPASAKAHAYLGLALAQGGRAAEAAAEYRESLRLDPGDRDVHYHLGLVLQSLGERAAAADELEAARGGTP